MKIYIYSHTHLYMEIYIVKTLNNFFYRNCTIFTKMVFLFYRLYYKSHISGVCNADCRLTLLCGLKSGRSHSPELCWDLGIHSLKDYHRLTNLKKLC